MTLISRSMVLSFASLGSLLLISTMAVRPSLGDETVVIKNFADGTLSGWSTKRLKGEHSAVVENYLVRGGPYAVRIELQPGDYVSSGWRAELTDAYNAPVGVDLWYGFSTYVPATYPVDEDNKCVLAQWHDQADLGQTSHKPMLAHRFNKGILYVTHDGDGIEQMTLYKEPAFAFDKWHDFVYHILWSKGDDGYIDGWIDRQHVVHFHGPTLYADESQGPYFKLGVYCAHDVAAPHVVFDSGLSRGGSFLAVDPATLIGSSRQP